MVFAWSTRARRHVAHVLVDGVAEEHQLHRRYARGRSPGSGGRARAGGAPCAATARTRRRLPEARAPPGARAARRAVTVTRGPPARRSRGRPARRSPRRQGDEHVLEARLGRLDRARRRLPARPGGRRGAGPRPGRPGAAAVRRSTWTWLAELGDALDLRRRRRTRIASSGEAAASRTTRPVEGIEQIRGSGHRGRAAVAQDAQAMAADRLVHVVGRDQHRRAVGGQGEDRLPELPAAARVDPGGGLVEEQQLRAVEDRGGEGQALAPAAREVLWPLVRGGRPGRTRSSTAATRGRRSAPSRPKTSATKSRFSSTDRSW